MPKPPLAYIQQELKGPNDNFIQMWKELSDKDKDDLKQWADEEQKVLGL